MQPVQYKRMRLMDEPVRRAPVARSASRRRHQAAAGKRRSYSL
jgi:hypothetical protein